MVGEKEQTVPERPPAAQTRVGKCNNRKMRANKKQPHKHSHPPPTL